MMIAIKDVMEIPYTLVWLYDI